MLFSARVFLELLLLFFFSLSHADTNANVELLTRRLLRSNVSSPFVFIGFHHFVPPSRLNISTIFLLFSL